MRFALLCLFAGLTAPEALAQRIAIVPFTGPGASALRNQVVSALCDQAECVSEKKVSAGGKPDWKKAKKEKVKFIVSGKVTAKGKKKTLELEVAQKAGPAQFKKSWPLDGAELSDKNLAAAAAALEKSMGLAKKEPPPEEKPPPEDKKPPPEDKKPPPEDKKPPPKKEKKEEPPPEEPVAPPPETATTQGKRPVFAAEVGVDFSSKIYTYSSVATLNLRSYSAPLIVGPDLRVEIYPLALISKGFIAGLGVEASYAFSIGLKSKPKNAVATYPTSVGKLDLALRFAIRPLSNSDAYFAPYFGYRSHSFGIGPASDGSTLDGPAGTKSTIPPTTYSALKIGVAGEIPFGNTGLLAFGRFAVLPVLSAREILGPNYFPNGSALGIDLGLGLGFQMPFAKLLQLRLSFDFARYGLSFKTAATDAYIAEGAVDQYLGGTLAARFTY